MLKSPQLEVVLVPTSGIGHLPSAVQLAKRIIQHDNRFSILVLILNLPSNGSMVNEFVGFQARQNPYPNRLTFMTLPPLSDPTAPSFFHTVLLHGPLVKQAVEQRIQQAGFGSTRLAGFILDMFCPAMMDVAADFNVPSYVYFTSGANFFNLWLHLQSLADDKGVDLSTEFSDPNTEFYIPGSVNRAPAKVIPAEFLDTEGVSMLFLDHARRYRRCKGILINTFTELEPFGIKALTTDADTDTVPAIYPVGPILKLEYRRHGGCGTEESTSILQWLNDQPSSSVVFLCFGSHGSFNDDQVKEIANGLEKSGHRFLWSLRKPSSDDPETTFIEAVPEGFLERTAGRGKIIGWSPQVKILAHPAIGGFVSHCGWNSTLESLWFGVPMAAWPLYAEQQMNAFMLVKELGLAVEIGMENRHDSKTSRRNNSVLISAEEVKNGVNKLINLDEETKDKVKEMRDKSRKALEEGGSSHKWLSRFVEDVLCDVA